MKSKELSPMMRTCLQFAIDHGNHLARFPGGFWMAGPEWHGFKECKNTWFGTTTVNALAARGRFRLWSPEGRTFPTRADVVLILE